MNAVKRFVHPLLLWMTVQTVIANASDISYCKFDGDLIFMCDKGFGGTECAYYKNTQIHGIRFSQNCTMPELLALTDLESFHHLYISKVNITALGLKKLDKRFFSKLEQPFQLFASHNALTELPDGIFHSKQMDKMDFSHNLFTDIESIGRSGVKYLFKLDLSNNNITHIRKQSFVNLTQLDELNLANNHIKLQNDLHVLQVSVFDHLKRLETLDLSRNEVTQIEFAMFVHLRNLYRLNVSGNHIVKIDISHLPPMNIQILDLSANQFDEIVGSLNYVFQTIHELDLRNNNFNCSHLKSLLNEFDARNLILDSSSKLMPERSYRGIACRPSIAELTTQTMYIGSETKANGVKLTGRNDYRSDGNCTNDLTGTKNTSLIVLIALLLMTVIGILVYVNREQLKAKFHQKCVIGVRKRSDLMDEDTISVL